MWVKKGSCSDFESYVVEKTGFTVEQLENTDKVVYESNGIAEAADMIRDAANRKRFIGVVADYDADGINSAAEIYSILSKLGVKNSDMRILIPMRMTDGYGIGDRLLSLIPDGSLLITIDNGIAAIDTIKKAKERKMTVIIMDHHLRSQSGVLPEADLIIDPEDNPDGWTFNGYCGAGLTYLLAKELFPNDHDFINKMSVFAMIATIGDLVNVTGENRNIILKGLDNLARENAFDSIVEIKHILEREKRISHFGTEEIAFNIAPMFNSPGRLFDDGGTKVLTGLFSKGNKSIDFASWLYAVNQTRKDLVNEKEASVKAEGKNISFAYVPDFPEGLCGILAGRICEETGKPTFVATDSSREGILKGSARSPEGINVFELMGKVKSLFTQYGGHAAAAGFSLKKDDLQRLIDGLDENADENISTDSCYDFEILQNELLTVYEGQTRIMVFGEGIQKPVIKIQVKPKEVKFIGKDKTTITFLSDGIKFIGFHMAGDYINIGMPKKFYVYGSLGTNWWNGTPSLQFEMKGMDIN